MSIARGHLLQAISHTPASWGDGSTGVLGKKIKTQNRVKCQITLFACQHIHNMKEGKRGKKREKRKSSGTIAATTMDPTAPRSQFHF